MSIPGFYQLRRHRFGFEAYFDWSLALVWSWPEEQLQALCGPGLELDTYEGQGFAALALVKTQNLRPTGWPSTLGFNFVLVGLRLFTRYRTPQSRRLRGLKILGGGADSRLMVLAGGVFSHYRYRHLRVVLTETDAALAISARGSHEVCVRANLAPVDAPPTESIFPDLKTARMFAGPMPFTFDYEKETHSMIRVEGVREAWQPIPVAVEVERNSFLERGPLAALGPGRLANAFLVRDVHYRWRAGVVERLAR